MQEVFNAIQFMLGTGCPVAGDMQGYPPFVGAKFQTSDQRALVRRIASHGKNGGTLDYVAGWFIMAGDYMNGGDARIGLVATNLITAGEQVTQLWPVLFGRCKLELAFAHRTFAWGSDARGKAHVHVVMLGLGQRKVARAGQTVVQLSRRQWRARGKPPRSPLPLICSMRARCQIRTWLYRRKACLSMTCQGSLLARSR